MRAPGNPAVSNRPGVTRLVGIAIAGTLSAVLGPNPLEALDFNGKIRAEAAAAALSRSPQVARKRRHLAPRLPAARAGRHLYPYPYYPPCPYYFPAYGTYPCFAQGYYPYPAYSYGFGFGGPFWRGGFGDDD